MTIIVLAGPAAARQAVAAAVAVVVAEVARPEVS